MRLFSPRVVRLSGHVCTIRLVATAVEGADSSDERNLDWLLRHRHSLETEMTEEVSAALGSNFSVTMTYSQGSVEVTAIIATVGVVYLSLSRYKNFVESLDLLVFHLRKVLARFSGPTMTTVVGSWAPAAALDAMPTNQDEGRSWGELNLVLVWYLVVTNAAFVAFLLWMTARR